MIGIMQGYDKYLTKWVYDELLRPEMERGVIVQKTFAEIKAEIRSCKAFIAMDRGSPVGYISFKDWQNGIELMTIVVDKASRNRGLGTHLATKVLETVRQMFPERKIMVLPNANSIGIFRKLGFKEFFKLGLPEDMHSACSGCPEQRQFPNCHCVTMVLPQANQSYISELDFEDRKAVKELAALYCETWKEPPWNEFDWQADKVIRDIAVERRNDIWLMAKTNKSIVGFAAGRVVKAIDREDFDRCEIVLPEVTAFITEIGVKPDARLRGLGREMNSLLVRHFKLIGMRSIVARTKAAGAIRIFESAGFEKTNVSMLSDPERFYWILKI